ncbi:type 4 pilus major pilin [Achromobacter insolitus]|uniref:type 4 pilus major pilin n=1 Tax=Achromobacter insolitus TaxID=217204 RepID=UPI0027E02C4F|nr:type 4 pilus major pilin [Achromobacter insolitus]MDQ6212249.1 prepilin-type N-terminal cleavage/methylation domain-containing protein [Achromobacter insolitus]
MHDLQAFQIHARLCRMPRQRGFSLMEVSIVTAIVLMIAIVGIPAIGSYVVENKVPKVGEELQRFIASMKTNAQGGGLTPYAGLDTGAMANALRESSVLTVEGFGSAARIAHGLGGSGVGGNGVVEVAAASLGSAGLGSAFSIKLTNVSQAACPSLASVLQRMSETISISGGGGLKVVKDAFATPSVPYRAAVAQAQCRQGDVNTFVFVAK